MKNVFMGLVVLAVASPAFAEALANNELLKCNTYDESSESEVTYTLREDAKNKIVFTKGDLNSTSSSILGTYENCLQSPENPPLITCRSEGKSVFSTQVKTTASIIPSPKGTGFVVSSRGLSISLRTGNKKSVIELDGSECQSQALFDLQN